MRARMSGRLGLLLVCLGLSAPGANAGEDHAFAETRAGITDVRDIFSSPRDHRMDQGHFTASATSDLLYTPVGAWENPPAATADVTATVGNLPNSATLLHLGVAGSVDGSVTAATAEGVATWDDTYLLGANLADDPHLDFIDFTFRIDGRFRLAPSIGSFLNFAEYPTYRDELQLNIWDSGTSTLLGLDARKSLGNDGLPGPDDGNFTSGDWATVSFWEAGDGSTWFDGTFHKTISLARNVGGDQVLYAGDWDISLGLYLSCLYGVVEADFSHTLTLTAVTLPDGSRPEDHGFSSTFESGIRPAAVPEPSGLSLALLGGVLALLGRVAGWHATPSTDMTRLRPQCQDH